MAEYWDCTWRCLYFGPNDGPQLLVDDGGDATLLMHRGYEAEDNPSILDDDQGNAELKEVNRVLQQVQKDHLLILSQSRWSMQRSLFWIFLGDI